MRSVVGLFIRTACASMLVFASFCLSGGGENTPGSGAGMWSFSTAVAQIRPGDATTPAGQESNLMHNLLEKQKELDNREKALKEEEKRLDALKKDVAEKMEALRVLEEKVTPAMETQKGDRDKRYQSLAKIYEATPPERAAAIFEKMDRRMAAEIMLRMNSKKAGAVWAHMNHEAGVQIAREITSTQSVDTAKAAKIAREITGGEVSKPETQSPDTGAAKPEEQATKAEAPKTEKEASAPAGAIQPPRDRAGAGEVKPETEKKEKTKSAAKREAKAAKSKKAKAANARSQTAKPFAIQIKAVRSVEMATEFTKMLKDEGLDAYRTEMKAKDGGTLYRILVGHFASREEALAYMKKNRIDTNYPGSYVQINGQAAAKKEKKK